jgi:hypothetical protein
VRVVSVDEAKLRLKVDTDDGDADIDLMILGASRACIRYIESGYHNFLDSLGEVFEDSNGIAIGIPDDVKNAVLVLVGMWLRDPSGSSSADWERGYLPAPVTAILYPLRDPSMA